MRTIIQPLFVILWGALPVLSLPAIAIAEDGVQMIRAKQAVAAWRLDPDTGRLFAIHATTNNVVEYAPTSGEELRTITVTSRPNCLYSTGSWLVSARRWVPGDLCVIDLKRDAVAGNVSLLAPFSNFLTMSSCPAEPNILYVLANRDEQLAVLRVDLEKLKVLSTEPVPNSSWHMQATYEMALSPDAQTALLSTNGDALMLLRHDVKAGAWNVASISNIKTSYAGGTPSGRGWIVGNEVWSTDSIVARNRRDDREEAQKAEKGFIGTPLVIHPTADLVVGVESEPATDVPRARNQRMPGHVVVQSFAKGELLKKFEFKLTPPDPKAKPDPAEPNLTSIALQIAPASQTVLCAYRRDALLVDLKATGIALHAPLQFAAIPSRQGQAGQALSIPLKLTAAGIEKQAKFEIVSGADGAKLTEQHELRWVPTAKDVGLHRVRVKATLGEQQDTAEFTVDVSRPAIELDFAARRMAINRDGTRAVVAGHRPPPQPREDVEREQNTELALLDLDKRTILKRRQFNPGVRVLAVIDSYVLYAPEQGNVIYVLSLDDLSDVKRFFTNQPAVGFQKIPPDRIAVVAQQEVVCYSTKTWERDWLPGQELGAGQEVNLRQFFPDGMREEELSSPVQPQAGVLINGLVLEEKSGQVCWVRQPPPILEGLVRDVGDEDEWRVRRGQRHQERVDLPPRLWSRSLNDRELRGTTAQPLARFESIDTRLMRDVPIAAALAFAPTDDGRRNLHRHFNDTDNISVQLNLVLRDLVVGAPKEELVIGRAAMTEGNVGFRDSFARPILADAGLRLVTAWLDKVYITELSQEQLAHFAPPLHVRRIQGAVRAKVNEPVTHRLEIAGGKGKHTLELLSEQPAVTLNAEEGTVKISAQDMWDRFKVRIVQGRERFNVEDDRGFIELWKQAREAYQAVFNEKTKDFPFAVRYDIGVTDEENQKDYLAAYVVFTVPEAHVNDFLAGIQAERRQLQAAAEADLAAQMAIREARAVPGRGLDEMPERAVDGPADGERELLQAIQANQDLQRQVREMDRQLASLRTELGLVKSGQVESGKVESGQVKTGQVKSGQDAPAVTPANGKGLDEFRQGFQSMQAAAQSMQAAAQQNADALHAQTRLQSIILVMILLAALAALLSIVWRSRQRGIGR